MEEKQIKPQGAKVDMLDVARVAQATDVRPFLLPGSIKLVAPAKVNLYLEIGARRNDGYHNAVSIMHTLLLHDVVHMRKSVEAAQSAGGIKLSMRTHQGLPTLEVPFEKNIVTKAIMRLAHVKGFVESDNPATAALPSQYSLIAHVEKHVPAQGGLGGGSADAAAALVGAARLWGLQADDPAIAQVAATLGADVPFFLHGGCVCLTGVGEVFDHALEPMNKPVVLVKPQGGVSTLAAYQAFDACPKVVSTTQHAQALSARRAEGVPLCNNLSAASQGLNTGIAEVLAWLEGLPGVDAAMMSGSGAAVFAVCETVDAATGIASKAKAKGWWARSTSFGNLRAMVVPRK